MKSTYSAATKKKIFALRARGLSYNDISFQVKVPAVTVGYWIRKAIAAHPRKNKNLLRKPIKKTANKYSPFRTV